jgi:hypothetical protein
MTRFGAGLLAPLVLVLMVAAPTVMDPADALPVRVPLEGRVERLSGDRMPGPGPRPQAAAAPGRRVVAISGTLAAAGQPLWRQPLPLARVLGSTLTDGAGRFRLEVPPGTVTLLIEVPGGYWLNRFDGQGNYASVSLRPGLGPVLLLDDRGAIH